MACALGLSAPAAAQVQRTLINLSFEQPALGAPACFRLIDELVVPGWITDHPVIATQTVTCNNSNIPGASATGRAMEFWTNGFNSVSSRSGTQHVELNAAAPSRMSQSVCLVNGEVVNWVFSHRGRNSATVQDVMDYLVGPLQIVRVGTTSNGTGGLVATSLGTASSSPGPNGWRDYQGSFTYTGATGSTNLGFQAISTSGGNPTVGNFLDDIQISLRPFIEFVQPAYSKAEGTAANNANIPRVRITGTVPAGGLALVANITGGTAVLGTDYVTPGNSTVLNIAIPAGSYDGMGAGSEFVLPVTLLSDAVPEPDETITFSLPPPGGVSPSYLLASTTTCGGVVNTASTLTISDTVARVSLAKSIVERPPGGQSGFDIRIEQNAGVVASASTGLGTGAANTTAGTGQQLVTPGVPVTLAESLAAGSAFQLNQFIATMSCSNATAGSPTVLPAGESPGASWALTPAANDDISCTITNRGKPPTITVNKTVGTRAAPADQFTVAVVQGATVLGSATTAGAATSASTGPILAPSVSGSYGVTDAMAAGSPSLINQYTATIACSNARPGGAAAVVVGGSAPNWTVGHAAGDLITCTVTNSRANARVVLAKSLAGARIAASDQFRMTVTGPGGGSGNTSGAGATVTGGAVTVASATPGTPYALSEAMAPGSASALAAYSGALACVNSRPGAATTLPSGPGASFQLTPLAGDNITCTLTNTPGTVQLTATKSSAGTTFRPGGLGSYEITVQNIGSAPATGASVVDTLPAGVTLAAPWTCVASAGSSCPASGGNAGDGIVALAVTVAPGLSVTLTVPVQYSVDPADY